MWKGIIGVNSLVGYHAAIKKMSLATLGMFLFRKVGRYSIQKGRHTISWQSTNNQLVEGVSLSDSSSSCIPMIKYIESTNQLNC